MGKSSKSKNKKFAKQERAMLLKNVELFEEKMSTLDNKFDGLLLPNGRKRERVELLEEQLQLTLKIEEAFPFINRHQYYESKLSRVCSMLLLEQVQSVKYIQAAITYKDMMNYPLTEEFRRNSKSSSNLLLLWTGRENDDRKDTIAMITKNAFDVIHKPEAMNWFLVVFLQRSLMVLIRQPIAEQHFKKVELLSLAMSKTLGKGEFKKARMRISKSFLVYSYIENLRFYFLGGQEQGKIQGILEVIQKLRPLNTNLSIGMSTYLAYTLLDFYTLIYKKKQHSLGSAKAITETCIDSLEKYISMRSTASRNVCYTCDEEDTPDQESLVCQGC